MVIDPERLARALDRHLPTLPVRRGLAAALLGIAFSFFLPVRPAITMGRSMEPTLHSGQPFLFSNRQSPREPYRPGDVLVFRTNGIPSVKRLAAVGGQVLWVIPRSKEDPRPLWAIAPGEDAAEWKRRFPEVGLRRYVVPEGKFFLVGDSTLSSDSREYGPVDEQAIMGRVTWPPVPENPEAWTFFHKLVPKPSSAQANPARSVRIARR